MIQKADAGRPADDGKPDEAPLEVRLTMRYRFGEAEDECVTVMDDRRVPMVGSVFQYRDRILRGFTTGLFKAAATQPRVIRELLPLIGSADKTRKRR